MPEEEIDRTSTLPQGIGAWRPFLGYSFDADPAVFKDPFLWEHGLTDRLTLVWMPLPLEARILLGGPSGSSVAADSWLTLDIALLGPMTSRDQSFDWRPSVQLEGRRQVGRLWGVRTAGVFGAAAQAEIRRVGDQRFGFSVSVDGGLLLQLTPAVAITPRVTVLREQGPVFARYPGELPPDTDGSSGRAPRWRLPLAIQATVQIHRQVQFRLQAEWLQVGYPSGYSSVPVLLVGSYFW